MLVCLAVLPLLAGGSPPAPAANATTVFFTDDFETCYSLLEFGGIWAWGADAPASMKPGKNLRTLLTVLKLLRQRRITPQRLKLLAAAADAPARPWL